MLHVYAHVDPGDAMKAARLQVLTTPVFRDWLRREARNAGVSVAKLVRTRCERKPTGEEQAVAKLASHPSRGSPQSEALKLTDVVRRAGETLKDLAPEIRDHDRRITAWRHNGKPLPRCRVSGWNDAAYSNPYFELGPDCATVLNCGPSLPIAARRSETSYPVW